MIFRNPINDHRVVTHIPWLWMFIFGPFYLMFKGIWGQGFKALLFVMLTMGVAWMFYPFAANSIVKEFYLKNGWFLE